MRWRVTVSYLFLWTLTLCWGARAEAPQDEADLKARVGRIIAEMSNPDPPLRERADVGLRNLPLQAYPIVTTLYAKEKEALDPEARLRIDNSIEMFKSLAALEERVRQYWAWMKENSLRAYDANSNRHPKWDKPAREAIALATTWPRDPSQTEQMRTLCQQAVEGGCEDPLFLYQYSLFYSSQPDADDKKALEILTESALEAIRRHPYPAWVRCMITSRLQGVLMRHPDLRSGEFSGMLPGDMNPFSSFNRIKPEDGLPPAFLYELADQISRQNSNDLVGFWYEKLAAPFERNAPGSPYLHVLKGSVFGRYASSTGDELRAGQPVVHGVEQRETRLATAKLELEKAFEMDPRLTMVPTEVLRILFERQAERPEIDKWLKKALEINPDNSQACALVLEHLPTDQKLEFGRQCFATRNWRGRLTFILVDAHEILANLAQEKTEYWQRPDVWKDLKQVYDTQLELFPQAVYDRSYYALLANQCHQWAEADRQFKILGDKPSLKVFGSMASYNYQRKKAAKNASSAQ